MGSLPANSSTKSTVPAVSLLRTFSNIASRWRVAISVTRGSSSRMRRGVNPLDTSVRSRRWSGSSMARKDIVFDACGPRDAGSSETPNLFDNVVLLRNPCNTSWCRESAQNPSSSLRYSGASSRSRW